jgi:hypothetical protein
LYILKEMPNKCQNILGTKLKEVQRF